MDTTLTRLQQILLQDYPLAPEALTRAARLEDLGIDSLATAELLFRIEDSFHLTVPNELVPLATLGDVVDYIDRIAATQADSPQPEVAPGGPVLAP